MEPRLGALRQVLAAAVLRSSKSEGIPQVWLEEPFEDMITRLLYQLRFISEQDPLSANTFVFIMPMLDQALASQNEEQAQLVLELVSKHISIATDESFPRLALLRCLLRTVQAFPKMRKEAGTRLLDLGRTIADHATSSETKLLTKGLLHPDAYARTVCLQCLIQFDLTASDWVAEIWIATGDPEAINSALAEEILEESNMFPSDKSSGTLMTFLGTFQGFSYSFTDEL